MDIKRTRIDLAVTSKWNIGYFIAGFIFWFYVSVVSLLVPLAEARIYWLVGTFFIFPVSVLASRLCSADPFSKQNTLGNLVGYTHMSVIAISFPLILIVFFNYPQLLLLSMAILYCLDFYVMTWVFDTPIFGINAAVRVIGATIIWLAFPAHGALVMAVFVSLCYLALILLIPVQRPAWLQHNSPG